MLSVKSIYKKGQSTLEISLVVGLLFLFLLGIVRIMGWFNSDMANRQQAYKQTRVGATESAGLAAQGVPYQTPRLDIFGEVER
jgi:hypothetical protein